MAWSHLSITEPHLVYILLGGFISLFILCSSFIKERLYIGEATIATIAGICFGPYAANLINPVNWGSVDIVTIEFSRIILVIQCFSVGVELPKFYMEKHWRSILFLLLPVTTFSWLLVSLFIWGLISPLSWLESLVISACITGTDPVLASSVVGQNKFARRVPKHLRDLLSAESGCNDAMSFLFVYLALYLIEYDKSASKVSFHFIVYTLLYECIFGAIYGLIIGYIARHSIKFAEKHNLIERRSFLVFYLMIALFCAGSGSVLGLDDLLVGFAAGVGFSNDGLFKEKTGESSVSNVLDLLLNIAYFVYLGTIIPWEQYNNNYFGMQAWRLAVIAILVLLFRRIPIIMALKPFIPDIRSWREALFVGHFGPIGAGAIFIAILARAELEHHKPMPLPELPPEYVDNYKLMYLVWPIVTFIVVSSTIVHGSSVAVFTLGKRINTLALTISYSKAPQEGPLWMDRLPRMHQPQQQELDFHEQHSATIRINSEQYSPRCRDGNRYAARFNDLRKTSGRAGEAEKRATVVWQEPAAWRPRDELRESSSNNGPFSWTVGGVKSKIKEVYALEKEKRKQRSLSQRHPEPARAYQYGSTLVVEDRDGEIIRTYQLPSQKGGEQDGRSFIGSSFFGARAKVRHPGAPGSDGTNTELTADREEAGTASCTRPTTRSSAWSGFYRRPGVEQGRSRSDSQKDDDSDSEIRFAIGGGGKPLTKDEFIREVQQLNNRTLKEAGDSTATVSPATSSFSRGNTPSSESP